VGLSRRRRAAVTGGNPFGAMMQAWKYSLPAFLVPFFFAATKSWREFADRRGELGRFIEARLPRRSHCFSWRSASSDFSAVR